MEKNGLLTPPSDSPPPPAYVHNESNPNVPDITAAFSNLKLAPSAKPTPDISIAHLKLLEAFHQLREDIPLVDSRFGIKDAFSDRGESVEERTELLTKIREKRWQVYVAKAAERFERWWTTCVEPYPGDTGMIGQSKLLTEAPDIGEKLVWNKDLLPPLGMVVRKNSFYGCANLYKRCHHGLACIHAESEGFP